MEVIITMQTCLLIIKTLEKFQTQYKTGLLQAVNLKSRLSKIYTI